MTLLNGSGKVQRKTLASQLDRLDVILDALSDGLNEAVASTVEQAVGTAVSSTVQAMLTELLTNSAVLARLRDVLAPVAPVTPAAPAPVVPPRSRVLCSTRLREHFQRARQRLAALANQARGKVAGLAGTVKGWCGGLAGKVGACLRAALPYRKPLLLSAGVGLVAGVTAYCAGPLFAAGAGWLAGFVTTLGVQAALLFRRMMRLGAGA
jgi:hypothetical protein